MKKKTDPKGKRKFVVTIEEVVYTEHTVQAKSLLEARELAEKKYCSESNEGHCTLVYDPLNDEELEEFDEPEEDDESEEY